MDLSLHEGSSRALDAGGGGVAEGSECLKLEEGIDNTFSEAEGELVEVRGLALIEGILLEGIGYCGLSSEGAEEVETAVG